MAAKKSKKGPNKKLSNQKLGAVRTTVKSPRDIATG
jgi:hypothetical protein